MPERYWVEIDWGKCGNFFSLPRQSACLIGVNKSVARGSVKFSRTNGGGEEDEENDLKKFTIWRKEKIEEKNRSTDKGAKREK